MFIKYVALIMVIHLETTPILCNSCCTRNMDFFASISFFLSLTPLPFHYCLVDSIALKSFRREFNAVIVWSISFNYFCRIFCGGTKQVYQRVTSFCFTPYPFFSQEKSVSLHYLCYLIFHLCFLKIYVEIVAYNILSCSA